MRVGFMVVFVAFILSEKGFASVVLDQKVNCPVFPANIVFAIDDSSSNVQTDPKNNRGKAVRKIVNFLQASLKDRNKSSESLLMLMTDQGERNNGWKPFKNMADLKNLLEQMKSEGGNQNDPVKAVNNKLRTKARKKGTILFLLSDIDLQQEVIDQRVTIMNSLFPAFIYSIQYGNHLAFDPLAPIGTVPGMRAYSSHQNLDKATSQVLKHIKSCLQNVN